jgi:hypothetical protein
MKKNAPHPQSTPSTQSEQGSESEPKTASDTNVPLSAQAIMAFNTLLLVIFIHLGEKGVLSLSQAAQLLEEFVDKKSNLPDGANAWLTEFTKSLWYFEKELGQNTIH